MSNLLHVFNYLNFVLLPRPKSGHWKNSVRKHKSHKFLIYTGKSYKIMFHMKLLSYLVMWYYGIMKILGKKVLKLKEVVTDK